MDKKGSGEKYNGKVIQISGKYSGIEENDTLSVIVFSFKQGIFGDEGIRCILLTRYKNIKNNLPKDSLISIKGFCSGYNETDVILTNCSIQKNKL